MARRDDPNVEWWNQKTARRHEILADVIAGVQERAAYRREMNLHCLRLYAERQILGLTAGTYSRNESGMRFIKPRLGLNVVRNCIDAATSMITRNTPAVSYVTTGEFELQERAKARTKFVQGMFHENQTKILGPRAFKDCGILGTGLVKICRNYSPDRKHGKVVFERTFPGEVWVDESEGIYGDPRSLFQERAVDAQVLRTLYPGKEKIIDASSGPDSRYSTNHSTVDQKRVFEAWHLPSAPGAKDGRHDIATDQGILFTERYKHEAFPFAKICFNEEPLGWWGTGLAYQLTGIQYEINTLVRQAQIGLYSSGNMKVAVERGSKIVKSQINNDMWLTKLEYTGKPPVFMTPEPLSATLREMLMFYIDQAYAITGISQLAARGEIPSGLAGSGRAQLVYRDTDSQRFVEIAKRYEQFHVDLAERGLEAANDIYEETGSLEVPYVNKRYVERLGFEDIEGDADEFCVQAEPMSQLPFSMAGRQALADDWKARGWIDDAQAKKIAGAGDIFAEMDVASSPLDLIDERLNRIISKGEYMGPTPIMDLELAFNRTTLRFQRAELDGVPADRLDMLSQFRDECQDMITEAEQAQMAETAAAQPPAPPAGPEMPGGPTATPTAPMPTEAAAWAPAEAAA